MTQKEEWLSSLCGGKKEKSKNVLDYNGPRVAPKIQHEHNMIESWIRGEQS